MLVPLSLSIAGLGLLLIVAGRLTRTGVLSRNPLVMLGTPRAAVSAQARAAVIKVSASTLTWAGMGGVAVGAVLLLLAADDPDIAALMILAGLWTVALIVAGVFRSRDIALRIERRVSGR